MNMLDMVREVITTVDGSTVNALDPQGAQGASKQAIAQRYIEQASQRIQTDTAWAFHEYEDVQIVPAADKTITLPNDALHVEPYGPDAHRRISYVGRSLYDHDNNSNQFDNPVYIRYKVLYTPECLPQHVQYYVVYEAACKMLSDARFRMHAATRMGEAQRQLRDAKAQAKCENNTLTKPQLNGLSQAGRAAAWRTTNPLLVPKG